MFQGIMSGMLAWIVLARAAIGEPRTAGIAREVSISLQNLQPGLAKPGFFLAGNRTDHPGGM